MRIWQDEDGTVVVTRIGRGRHRVPGTAWDAFTEAVKHCGAGAPELE